MKKKILLLSLSLSTLFASNYTLNIGDQKYQIDINENKKISIDGKKYDVSININDIQYYKSDFFEFKFFKELKPTAQNLNETIRQTVLSTPVGEVIMLQEYKDTKLDMNKLFDIMKNELSKGRSENTIISKNKNITKKLNNGKILKGIKYKIIDQYGETLEIHKMYFYDKGNNNSLFIFELDNKIIDNKNNKSFELFWKTLTI
jgi:hypothetical protein